MPALLDKRLVFVTGKGGVGKSTVAVALGLLAARRGLRTIVAEVAGQDRLSRAFARAGVGFTETELAERLWAISIDPREALEEYLTIRLPVKPLADLLGGSRMFQYFAAATPGMSELLTMGKLWELAQLERRARDAAPYDLVIVDAPATGHGVAVLRAPRTFAAIARVGPIAHQGSTIDAFVTDPERCAIVAVTHAQEMSVNETVQLRAQLREDVGRDLDLTIANGLYPERFGKRDATTLRRALETSEAPLARAALLAAGSARLRREQQDEQLARLQDELGAVPLELPFRFEPDLDIASFEALSLDLETQLEGRA